jgi:serine/threonine protein kinase
VLPRGCVLSAIVVYTSNEFLNSTWLFLLRGMQAIQKRRGALQKSPMSGPDTSELYEYVERIGEGTFGEVHKAKDVRTGELVAIKRVRLRDLDAGGGLPWFSRLVLAVPPSNARIMACADIPNTALREMRSLQELCHPNVVRIAAVFPAGSSLSLVFECMACDLGDVIRSSPRLLHESEIKCIMWMLLQGLAYCHANAIIHRVSSRCHVRTYVFRRVRTY